MRLRQSILILAVAVLAYMPASAQFNLNNAIKQAQDKAKVVTGGSSSLSNSDIIAGLKDALNVGTGTATKVVSAVGGYYNNAQIKIPFPPEVQKVQQTLSSMGMQKQVDDFVRSLNNAAEEAAKSAAPVFVDAVKQMTVDDGLKILKGRDNEATLYLQAHTQDKLKTQYKPIVNSVLDKVNATKYWKTLADAYNKIPFIQKVNPDLGEYTTNKALDGLFYMVGQEEAKIRKDPAARVTDILKKVFGNK
jgi:hypothetical protein